MRGCTGTTDRVICMLIGIVALGVGLTALGTGWAYAADAVGVIGIVTGILGRCPLYALFRLQTCGRPV